MNAIEQAEQDCEHDDVQAERAYLERPEGTFPLGIVGTCLDCGAPMALNGEPDEEGHPTWAEDWTPEELVTILHQSGLV